MLHGACHHGEPQRPCRLRPSHSRHRYSSISVVRADASPSAAIRVTTVFDFVTALKERNATPHIAIDGNIRWGGIPRKTAIDRRTTRHPGYWISQCIRKRIEEIFGWTKSTAGLVQLKVRGLRKANAAFILALAAYNLIRLPKLLEASS